MNSLYHVFGTLWFKNSDISIPLPLAQINVGYWKPKNQSFVNRIEYKLGGSDLFKKILPIKLSKYRNVNTTKICKTFERSNKKNNIYSDDLNFKGQKTNKIKYHLNFPFLFDGKWKREVTKGVKGDRDFRAFRTNDRRFEETLKQVQDHRVVPSFDGGPSLACDLL